MVYWHVYWVRYSNTQGQSLFGFLFLIHSSSWLPKNYISTLKLPWVSWIVKKKKKVLSFFLLLSGTRTEIVFFFLKDKCPNHFHLELLNKTNHFVVCLCVQNFIQIFFSLLIIYQCDWMMMIHRQFFFSFFLEWMSEWMTEWNKKKGRKPVDDDRTTRTIWQWKC